MYEIGTETGSLRIRCGNRESRCGNTVSQKSVRTRLLKGEARDTDAGLTF